MAKRPTSEPLPTRVIGPCKDTQGADVADAVGLVQKDVTDEMVNRFLRWPLPRSVCSDLCVTDRDYEFPRCGTNLLTADEARQMLEFVLASQENGTAPQKTKVKRTDKCYPDCMDDCICDRYPEIPPDRGA